MSHCPDAQNQGIQADQKAATRNLAAGRAGRRQLSTALPHPAQGPAPHPGGLPAPRTLLWAGRHSGPSSKGRGWNHQAQTSSDVGFLKEASLFLFFERLLIYTRFRKPRKSKHDVLQGRREWNLFSTVQRQIYLLFLWVFFSIKNIFPILLTMISQFCLLFCWPMYTLLTEMLEIFCLQQLQERFSFARTFPWKVQAQSSCHRHWQPCGWDKYWVSSTVEPWTAR